MSGRAAVFLDRDGTVAKENGYLVDPAMLEILPGSAKAVKRLNNAGLLTVLVTNQSGAARGLFSLESVGEAHEKLERMLAEEGARLDGVYFCPHHPDGKVRELAIACDCRKPEPGLFEQAIEELDIDPAKSFAVGDSYRDLVPAKSLGARTVLVLTGYGEKQRAQGPPDGQPEADHVGRDLAAAVDWILEQRTAAG